MGYYTVTDGGPDVGRFNDFDEALAFALNQALLHSADDEEAESIEIFVNGAPGPWRNTDAGRTWEAGAGPANDPCADGLIYWPHVEWRGNS